MQCVTPSAKRQPTPFLVLAIASTPAPTPSPCQANVNRGGSGSHKAHDRNLENSTLIVTQHNVTEIHRAAMLRRRIWDKFCARNASAPLGHSARS